MRPFRPDKTDNGFAGEAALCALSVPGRFPPKADQRLAATGVTARPELSQL